MIRACYALPVLFVSLMAAASPVTAETWIRKSDYAGLSVVASDPKGANAKAVGEFVAYWERATGFRPVVRAEPGVGANVWIGSASLPQQWKRILDLDTLGFDGIALQVFPSGTGKDLVLAGGPGHGTLYAVYEFLENGLGIRWLRPGVVHVPKAPEKVEVLNYRYSPAFQHRLTGLPGGMADADHYRIHSPYVYGMNYHTFYELLPPEEYFAEHPEYYAEVDGKRIGAVGVNWRNMDEALAHLRDVGQLCMSNPDVAEALFSELKARIRENPEANLWAVSQMDWGNTCACPRCKEIDAREGTPAGSILTGVNRVAELIEKEYPSVAIQTYAYAYTRKPPKTIRPRRNVIVQLCSLECDFARAFDDPKATANRSFVEDLRGWNALGAKLFLYDYPLNCRFPPRPFPNEHVMGRDLAFMARNGAIGAFEQGHAGEACAFGFLKAYVISKLLWNPEADPGALAHEFINLYYGESATYIWKYFQLAHDTLRRADVQMFAFDDCGWIDRTFVEKGEALFKQALDAAESEETRKRVDLEYFQVQYATSLCRPRYTFEKDRVVISRPPMLTRETMMKRAEETGIKASYPASWLPNLDAMLQGFPTAETNGVSTSPLVALENERYFLWLAPELKGSILRIRDKKHRLELLRGYETYDTAAGTYQEWNSLGDMGEGVAARSYEVIARSEHEATISAKTKSGLRLDRTMRLAPGSDSVEIRLVITNDTSAQQAVSVKLHPEFYCQRAQVIPEIWCKSAGEWHELKTDDQVGTSVGFQLVTPSADGVWGVYVPRADVTLVNTYKAGQLDRLLCYYNTGKGATQINIETIPLRKSLQPGEQHCVETTYTVVRGRPSQFVQH